MQLEIDVSRAQAAVLLPHYTAYRARQAALGTERATAMSRLMAVQVGLAAAARWWQSPASTSVKSLLR